MNTLAAYTTNTWVSPLAILRLVGPARHAGYNLIRGNDGDDILPDRVLSADGVIIQRDFPRHGAAYHQIVDRARTAGKPVIFDLDDWLFELPQDHPDHATRYYAEAFFPMLQAIVEADAITASTPLLCDYLRPFNPNVYLLPNFLDDAIWTFRPVKPAHSGGAPVVISYMGGDSHLSDVQSVAVALLNVAKRYGERVRFQFLGTRPPDDLLALPNLHWEEAKTFVYADFAANFIKLDCDIFIAPLRDNRFNRCKSAIKFLEYSALGVPGVYSRLETYSGVVVHGENGYLAEAVVEWEEYLSRLIENPAERAAMGRQAQNTVQRDWLMSVNAHRWVDVYNRIISGRERIVPPEVGVILQAARQAQDWQQALQEENQALAARLAEKGAEIQSLSMALATHKLEAQSVTAKIAQMETERDSFSRRLWQIEHSRLGRFLLSYRSFKAQLQKLVSNFVLPQKIAVEFDGDVNLAGPADPLHYDIIVLPVMDWESRKQRPQHIACQFARAGHRVFYARTGFHQQFNPRVRSVAPNIIEIQLPAERPVNLYREAMDGALKKRLVHACAVLRKTFHIGRAVCLVDLPFWTPLALQLHHKYGWKLVYDCMDYHQGFSTNTEQMWQMEEMLARESDLVLVTSHFLESKLLPFNPRTLRVPNGVEFEHFHSRPAGALPLSGLPWPIIGYYGAIADWFDTTLISRLARARPEWHFVLIGSTLYADLSPLAGLGNVHLLGEKPYTELPPYLHAFDVAIIPFKKTPLTEATNPVKLYEYLSAGKPVVATDLNELRHYRDFVRLAATPDEWLMAIEAALRDSTTEQVQARQDFACQNTWEQRFDLIEKAISGQ